MSEKDRLIKEALFKLDLIETLKNQSKIQEIRGLLIHALETKS